MNKPYKYIVLGSEPLKEGLISTALKCGWEKWAYCNPRAEILFVYPEQGSIGTAVIGSIIQEGGEPISMDSFLTYIVNPPPMKPVVLDLPAACVTCFPDGNLMVDTSGMRLLFGKLDAQRIFDAYKQVNKL